MEKDDRIRLLHMRDAAREAQEFARNRSCTDLNHDRMLVLALVKEIESIGEAANLISNATREQLPDTPWEDIVGMRHRLIHAYFGIDLEILWRTVIDDLPPLVRELEGALEG